MKRKAIKVSLIVISILTALILISALLISPIAKNYIQKHSKDMIGRKVQIQGLHLNIFTGTLELDSVSMFEQNDKDVFASIDTFYVNIELTKLLSKKLEIAELKVIRPYLVVLQNGDLFNFDDLMSKKDTAKKDTSKSSFPRSTLIKNITIRGGKLIYTDQKLVNTIKMNELAVTIPSISFGNGNTKSGVHLKVGDIATIDSKLIMNMKTKDYQLNLLAKDLNIDMIKPYVAQYLNIGEMAGLVSGNLFIAGKSDHIMDFKLSGTADGKKLIMTNSFGEPMFTAENTELKINQISKTKALYLFDYIHASNAKLDFVMNPDPKPNNFMAIFKPDNPKETTKSIKNTFKVTDLRVSNSQLIFTDKTISPNFKLPINNVDFQAKNFDLDGKNEYKMNGSFSGGGNIDFNWVGDRSDFSNQQIMINLQNFGLKIISPYCKHYTAYDITKGNMNFVSKTKIKNNEINSSNIVDVYRMDVGKKHKELKVKYNVPLKLALYVMKDKDDKINFNLPVKGNMKDPKFSYSQIVWQTVVNLMVKVALSPFKFLAGALGLNPDKMESIQINPLQTNFTAEQYSQFNDLSAFVKKKPDMVLELTQFAPISDVLEDYAIFKAKYAYLYSMSDTNKKDPFTFDEVQTIPDNDRDFVEFVDSTLTAKGKLIANFGIKEKSKSLYVPDSLQNELFAKFENRNANLRAYLNTSLGIPDKNIMVKTASKDTLSIYKDKSKYKIEMSLPGTDKAN